MKMPKLWIHPTTYTYRKDAPQRRLETLWVERAGWGYLMRRDLWIETDSSERELRLKGFEEIKPLTDPDVAVCPSCGMYICSAPGGLREAHFAECGGNQEDNLAMEDAMVSNLRWTMHERAILERLRREKEELEEQERKERFDKIREEALARQQSKDRKKRLKEEVREQLRKR